jgi:hypothetical protein
MPALSICVRPDRVSSLNVESLKVRLAAVGAPERLVSKVNITTGHDNGRYVIATYSTEDVNALWSLVRSELISPSALDLSLTECAIVVCTGQHDWDDYLLLHHFDATQALDKLP